VKKAISVIQPRKIEAYCREFLELAISICFFRLPKFKAFMLANATSHNEYKCTEEQQTAINEYYESLYNVNETKLGAINVANQVM